MNKEKMNRIIKAIVVMVLCFAASESYAQTGLQIKAEQALEDGSYVKALKYAEKACEAEESSKDPWSYALRSEALYYISQDADLREKYPSSMKDAVKMCIKAFKKADKEGTLESFKEENQDLLVRLKDANNREAATYARLGKASKAIALYKISYDLAKDTFSYFMIGRSYELMEDGTALDYYRAVANWNAAAYEKGNLKSTYQAMPFIYLGNYFLLQDSAEKARYYTYTGLEMFPDNYSLQKQKYDLIVKDLKGLPPSGEYLDIVQGQLKNFPSDSFMLHKENAMYLYLVNNAIVSKDSNSNNKADSLINAFAKRKQGYFNSKKKRKIMRNDPFVKEMKQEVRMLMVDYYNNFGNANASNYVFDYWIKRTYKAKETEASYLKEISDLEKVSRVGLISQLYDHTALKYASKKALKQKSDYFYGLDFSTVPYSQAPDYLLLNEAVVREFPTELGRNRLRINRLKYIDASAKNNEFFHSYFALDQFVKEYGSSVKTDSLIKDLAMRDFDLNYFGTAIKKRKIGTATVPDIKWQDGSATSCRIGYLPDTMHQKVLDRINYFRRNAGIVKPTVLVKQMNTMCQQAAVMFEANKLINHEPPNTWKCWTTGAAAAAKNSLITQKTNSVLAVTSFMQDNKDFVGNRRWLLNPYAKGMGHGSTYGYSAIWAMNLGDLADSVYYKDHYVAWPSVRPVPKMLAFDYWSFALHGDVKGATVTMADELGENVPLKVAPYKPGYGLPTIVWKPTVDLSIKGDLMYQVNITLADGTEYHYKVNLIDYKPVFEKKKR